MPTSTLHTTLPIAVVAMTVRALLSSFVLPLLLARGVAAYVEMACVTSCRCCYTRWRTSDSAAGRRTYPSRWAARPCSSARAFAWTPSRCPRWTTAGCGRATTQVKKQHQQPHNTTITRTTQQQLHTIHLGGVSRWCGGGQKPSHPSLRLSVAV